MTDTANYPADSSVRNDNHEQMLGVVTGPKTKKARAPYSYLVIYHHEGDEYSRNQHVADRGSLKAVVEAMGAGTKIDQILKVVGEVKMKASVEFEF